VLSYVLHDPTSRLGERHGLNIGDIRPVIVKIANRIFIQQPQI